MYGTHDYARMIADGVRTGAYVQALEATVRRGTSIVVDMGTGTGVLALVACRFGARRVYAIDTNPAIAIGRELARENHCEEQIVFLQEDVCKVRLPERADVVVSDMHGGLPLAGANLDAVAHAREHFLAANGVLIPARETLLVAVVSCGARYEAAVGNAEVEGVTLTAMRSRLSNAVHKDRTRSLSEADLVTPGAVWATLDYRTAAADSVVGRAEWTAPKDRIGHGLVLWFETVLSDGCGFSTAPGLPSVYPQIFLPWTEPFQIRSGDVICVDLCAVPEGNAWGWITKIQRDGSPVQRFKQSTLLSEFVLLPNVGGAGMASQS